MLPPSPGSTSIKAPIHVHCVDYEWHMVFVGCLMGCNRCILRILIVIGDQSGLYLRVYMCGIADGKCLELLTCQQSVTF